MLALFPLSLVFLSRCEGGKLIYRVILFTLYTLLSYLVLIVLSSILPFRSGLLRAKAVPFF